MELLFFYSYSPSTLERMGAIYYSGKATPAQAQKYEAIRAGLLADLRGIFPDAKDSGSALYLHQAITAALEYNNLQDKINNDQARANMETAHNQLKNWK